MRSARKALVNHLAARRLKIKGLCRRTEARADRLAGGHHELFKEALLTNFVGILTSLGLKVGLPIAAIAVAGLLLARFREPIVQSVQAGASTVGQAIASPFGAVLSGIQTALQNVPSTFTIPIPEIQFAFGEQNPSSPLQVPPSPTIEPADPNSAFAGAESVSQDECGNVFINGVLHQAGTLCDNVTPEQQPSVPNTSPIPAAEATGLTPFEPERSILVNFPTRSGEIVRERLPRAEIIQMFPEAVGLFDLTSTQQTEFIPLSEAELALFPEQDFRLSGQLFEEIKSRQDVV